ncbi:Ankyrin-1 [Lachnellula hyalina]|uniref:Ankyrin-1 n=1 Tax=Lachnellula hyalina TaxID=1316788 RepID=A0A8H8U489_9HELO|nr:Ankyrin-1 [Lachnellula hyalina]TVY30865.1 Ankyrin-1 [Lachnellula hyalina]
MDPVSAIGIASAVVQFVQFGFLVVKRLDELNKAHPGEVPRSLQAISTQLPLLLDALKRIKTDSEVKTLDVDTKCILRGVVSGCHGQVAEIETMINELSRSPGENFKTKIKKVFNGLKYDEKIWAVERNLNTYISVLILHHVVDSTDMPPVTAEDSFFDVREQLVATFSERSRLTKEIEGCLYDASRSQVKEPTIVTLSGPEGVGKTQLAVAYCHATKARDEFRTVFWLDASTLESLLLGFESIYATIQRSTSGTRKHKVSFVRAFLDDLWHPWLLVLDNYEPTALYNDIMEVLPTRGYGGIMFITRSEDKSGLGDIIRVPLFLTIEDQLHLNSLLTKAVQDQSVERIKDLVNQGADVDSLIWNEWPCLHRCALFGLDEAVEFLLERGANPNPPLQVRKPIYWAASGGHTSICRLLLDHEDQNSQIFKPVDIQAAYDAAGEKGSLDIMHLLLNRREPKLNSKNGYGRTPLHNSAMKGYLDMVNFLLEHGVIKEDPAEGQEALIQASSSGHLDIVKRLCSAGVDVNFQDTQGLTPLCHAAGLKGADHKESGVGIAELLLASGADPNITGSDGPLHKASTCDHINMVSLLITHGADPTKDCAGWCPLTNSIKYKSPKAMTLLLEVKMEDTKARSDWLNSGLRYACRTGDREAIVQVLAGGADINSAELTGSPKGATPLLLTILNGHVQAAQLLVRRGAKIDLGDEMGRLPLPTAAERGYDSVVRGLIRAGGDPNIKSGVNEDTPLILAAGKKQDKVVKVLLDNKADKMLANKFGDIALDVAEEKGYKEIIELLEG